MVRLLLNYAWKTTWSLKLGERFSAENFHSLHSSSNFRARISFFYRMLIYNQDMRFSWNSKYFYTWHSVDLVYISARAVFVYRWTSVCNQQSSIWLTYSLEVFTLSMHASCVMNGDKIQRTCEFIWCRPACRLNNCRMLHFCRGGRRCIELQSTPTVHRPQRGLM